MVLLRQSFSQGMVDEYDEVREGLERLHGMDRAVALVKQRIEQQGTLPGSLMQVLCVLRGTLLVRWFWSSFPLYWIAASFPGLRRPGAGSRDLARP